MKKIVTGLAAGIIMLVGSVTTVSAEEYEVQAGDSLWEIANENNTSIDELIDINDLKTTVIHPKQILLLNETYVVESGDSLISIAEQYDVTVDEIIEWNNLESNKIVTGQELHIKGVSTKQTVKPKEKSEAKAEEANVSNDQSQGKTMSVTATAYTASCAGCSGITYTGVDLNKNPDAKVIAVDPNVIPLGSKVYVEGYGYATAADIGSAIHGKKIDVFIPNADKAKAWGTRKLNITIVD